MILLPLFASIIIYTLWHHVYWPSSQIYGKTINYGSRHQRQVALTFDDGPNPQATGAILDILKQNNTSATFFVVGANAKRYPDLLKRIAAEGHEIGVHSWSHSWCLIFWLPKFQHEDLQQTIDEIMATTGKQPALFRPPWGNRTPWLQNQVRHLGLTTITWSLDSGDALPRPTTDRLIRRCQKIKNGDIVLFHDGHGTTVQARNATIGALPKVLAILQQKGYTLTTVSQLLHQ